MHHIRWEPLCYVLEALYPIPARLALFEIIQNHAYSGAYNFAIWNLFRLPIQHRSFTISPSTLGKIMMCLGMIRSMHTTPNEHMKCVGFQIHHEFG